MRYREIINEIELDYGDFDDESDTRDKPPIKAVDYRQQRVLDRHRQKQNRAAFRSAEQKRREREQELYAPDHDYYGNSGSRHVPKSAVGYRPFAWPMIRFGLFRSTSKIGFDAEMRREMGNVTHEMGVSCFRAIEHRQGYLILEHAGRSSWTGGSFDPDRMLYPWVRQMRTKFERWLHEGTPMDIFLLRGHLVAYGKHNEWLSCGADGEYLLDTSKPYKSEQIDANHLWLTDRMSLRQYYETTRPHWSDGSGEEEEEDGGY